MQVPAKGVQRRLIRNQSKATVNHDQKIGHQAGEKDGPEEGHPIGSAGLGHGRHAPGSDVKPE